MAAVIMTAAADAAERTATLPPCAQARDENASGDLRSACGDGEAVAAAALAAALAVAAVAVAAAAAVVTAAATAITVAADLQRGRLDAGG